MTTIKEAKEKHQVMDADHNIQMRLLDLCNEPRDQPLSKEDVSFIKDNVPIESYKVKYGIWKQVRRNGKCIIFIIDSEPLRLRKCAADHSIEVVCTRELTLKEYDEEIQNWGCNNRVMKTWGYEHVENLIADDKKYGIETPEKFIEKCKKLGHSTNGQLQTTNGQLGLF